MEGVANLGLKISERGRSPRPLDGERPTPDEVEDGLGWARARVEVIGAIPVWRMETTASASGYPMREGSFPVARALVLFGLRPRALGIGIPRDRPRLTRGIPV